MIGRYLPKAVSFADTCRQKQNMLLKNCGLCSKVWESRALPSNLTLIFFQSIASSRVLAYFRMFFGLSSHVSHIFLNNLKCIGSVHLPSLPASNAILLDSCFLDPHLPWLYPEVPNFVFLLESFSHPIFFFFHVPLPSAFPFSSLIRHACVFSQMWSPYQVLFLNRTSADCFCLAASYVTRGNVWFLIFFFLLYCFVGLFSLFNWIREFSLPSSWHKQRAHLTAEQQWDPRLCFRHRAIAAQKHNYGEHPTYC